MRTLREAGHREGLPRRHHHHGDGAGHRQVTFVTRASGRWRAARAGSRLAALRTSHEPSRSLPFRRDATRRRKPARQGRPRDRQRPRPGRRSLARPWRGSRARVVINCRARPSARGGPAARRSSAAAARRSSCRADVSDYRRGGRPRRARRSKAFGRLDVLVNTVGALRLEARGGGRSAATGARMMASNLDSVYNMSRLALPHMRAQPLGPHRQRRRGGRGAARRALPNVAAFSAAKAGVIAFSKALALEEARCGVTVNVVCPACSTDGDDADTEVARSPPPPGSASARPSAAPARSTTWCARSSSSPPPPPTT